MRKQIGMENAAMMNPNALKCLSAFVLALVAGWLPAAGDASQTKPARRPIAIFLDLKETNLDQVSSVATNTLSERLTAAKFRVTTSRREAALILEGTIRSRTTPVTDEVKREGGVNAEATASLRLLAGTEVIATSVERSAPGDWGVQAERVGEDRLIEVADLIANDLFNSAFVTGIHPVFDKTPAPAKSARKPARKPGVGFLELVTLVQNYAPEDRILGALKKYGIKFKPKDAALQQLRTSGASDGVINAVKASSVV
jgi:hypothetical protein